MLQDKAVTVFCAYLEAQGRTKRTVETNEERLRYFQKELSLQKVAKLEDVSPELVDFYIAKLYRQGLSKFTIAGRIQTLKSFYRWTVKRGYISSSPTSHLQKPRLNYNTKNKAISQKDLENLISTANSLGKILEEAMLVLLADTGCRAGELCSINIDDIDFVKCEVLVRGKTGERLLDFTQKTHQILNKYLLFRKSRAQNQQKALFVNSRGKRITPGQLYLCFRRVAEKSDTEVDRFNPQAIRHRVGQGWLDQGANLELVRQKLGHSDIQTTASFYAHQDRTRLKAATKKFSIVKDIY